MRRVPSTLLPASCVLLPFSAFSLAVVSALTEPEALGRLVRLMCLTPVICAVLLGPFLGFRRAPVVSNIDPIHEIRARLEPFNEGQGKWRVLSHVRSDGRAVRIDLHNSTQQVNSTLLASHM